MKDEQKQILGPKASISLFFFNLMLFAAYRAKLAVLGDPWRSQQIKSAELSVSLILIMNCNNCAMNQSAMGRGCPGGEQQSL